MAKTARDDAIAAVGERAVSPQMGLSSRAVDGLRRLARSLLVEESIDAAESRSGKHGRSGSAPAPIDAGITGGLSLLFGDTQASRS
jgi:hypothetical protein